VWLTNQTAKQQAAYTNLTAELAGVALAVVQNIKTVLGNTSLSEQGQCLQILQIFNTSSTNPNVTEQLESLLVDTGLLYDVCILLTLLYFN
jgi:hypothetical protein